jgi:hypothetical protein
MCPTNFSQFALISMVQKLDLKILNYKFSISNKNLKLKMLASAWLYQEL